MPSITLPPHAIHSYRWSSHPATAAAVETDRLQTTLATPADHADAQALLRAARQQSAPPQAQAARRRRRRRCKASCRASCRPGSAPCNRRSRPSPPARPLRRPARRRRRRRATPSSAALPTAAAPGQHGLGVAALWAVPLGLLVPLVAAAALRRRRCQSLPVEASRASPWAEADYLPTAAVEAPEEGAAYLEFAPTR